MLVIVAYDVPSDRRRTRLAHALKDFGERVQYSVFECRLEADELDRLRARVRKLLKTEEDQLRIYRLCANCSPQVELFGAGRVIEDTDVIVI